jgi:hypothetical protein
MKKDNKDAKGKGNEGKYGSRHGKENLHKSNNQ